MQQQMGNGMQQLTGLRERAQTQVKNESSTFIISEKHAALYKSCWLRHCQTNLYVKKKNVNYYTNMKFSSLPSFMATNASQQARNQLGTLGGAKSFLRGAQIF